MVIKRNGRPPTLKIWQTVGEGGFEFFSGCILFESFVTQQGVCGPATGVSPERAP